MSDQTDITTSDFDGIEPPPAQPEQAGAFTVAAADGTGAEQGPPRRTPEEVAANRRAWREAILAKQRERRGQ